MDNEPTLKQKTAGTLKWNTIDRVGTQVLYAVTGVVLANVLTKEDFGLVGALLVFQAFANLFVDSGFGAALLQQKNPSQRDYTTIFWFNLAMSTVVYIILFLCAPLIADIFQGDKRLIPLSKVMFTGFILNGLGMVQTTRLMKSMNVKMIAVANMLALTCSGALGIGLALGGYGAWALVWQTVTMSGVKSAWLWFTGHWLPSRGFYMESLRKMWRVGLSVFSTSSLNTFFLYIYSFVIGAFYNLVALGVYTQADKWSKMGSASISQILTASFVPVLARVQDDGVNFRRYMNRINRFAAFICFPILGGMAAMGSPIFHLLFGTKWDAAIPLFEILALRGIPVVLISLYNNYLLALGYGKRMVTVEIVKDAMIFVAIGATIWAGTVEMLVWGQLAASLVTWIVVMCITSQATGYTVRRMLADLFPFALTAATSAGVALLLMQLSGSAIIQLLVMATGGLATYIILAKAVGINELSEALSFLHKKKSMETGKKR